MVDAEMFIVVLAQLSRQSWAQFFPWRRESG